MLSGVKLMCEEKRTLRKNICTQRGAAAFTYAPKGSHFLPGGGFEAWSVLNKAVAAQLLRPFRACRVCDRLPSSLSDLDGSGRKRELKKVKGPLLD